MTYKLYITLLNLIYHTPLVVTHCHIDKDGVMIEAIKSKYWEERMDFFFKYCEKLEKRFWRRVWAKEIRENKKYGKDFI